MTTAAPLPQTSAAPAPAQRPSTFQERLAAAAIHLALSATAVGLLAAAMWFVLYPPPYFWVDGGWTVLRILLLADVILGPMLTFVVFNRAKPEWRRDLVIIAIVQVVAFAYGTYTMARYRPVFAVYIDRSFFAVTWPKVEMATQDLAKPRALHGGDWAPTLVVMDMPPDRAQQLELLRKVNPDGTSALPGMGDRYLAFSGPVRDAILANSADIEALARGNADITKELARIRATHPGPLSNYSFQPLGGRDDQCMLVFEKASGKLVDCMK
jgi:hypothetical protein